MKRILSLILTALMLISALAACGGGGTSGEVTTSAGEDTAETAAETDILDYLPDTDYKGREFRILQRDAYAEEFHIEEENGEILNDSLYRRNQTVSEMFNIVFTYTEKPSTWGGGDPFNKFIIETILAGDDAYDLAACYAAMILGSIYKGYYIDWYDVPVVDFSRPWWSEQIAESLTVGGKMFAVTGDLCLTLWEALNCIYFNKKIAENVGAGDMYALVRDGDWTITELINRAKNVSADLNGDGQFTVEADSFGYLTNWATAIDSFQPAFNIKVLDKDDDGMLYVALNNQRTVNALSHMTELFYSGNFAYMLRSGPVENLTNAFKADRGLFLPAYLDYADIYLRDMDSDWGILPYPKMDTSQSDYYSNSIDYFSLVLVPGTVTDVEFVGTVTEGLCVVSNQEVVPTYYNIVLKDKYSRDLDSADMLDIIRDSVIFDIGYLNSFALDGVGHIFVNLVRENSTDIASRFASKEAAVNAKLEIMLEAYTD